MVMSFDDRIEVLCRATSDRHEITRAIRRTRTGGSTRLYDAVEDILIKQLKRVPGRKAVVLFTDGVDTSSSASYGTTLRLESQTPIYSVGYDTSVGGVFGQGVPLPGGRGTIMGLPLPRPGEFQRRHGRAERLQEGSSLPEGTLKLEWRSFLQWRFPIWDRAGFYMDR